MAFERDLGYLGKFFDNLEAHADTLGGDAGARLRAFVAEERDRWHEVTRLLTGDAAPDVEAKPKKAKEATAVDVDADLAASTPTPARPEQEPAPVLPSARSPRDEDPGRVPPPHRAAHAVPAPPSPVGAKLTVGSLIGRDS